MASQLETLVKIFAILNELYKILKALESITARSGRLVDLSYYGSISSSAEISLPSDAAGIRWEADFPGYYGRIFGGGVPSYFGANADYERPALIALGGINGFYNAEWIGYEKGVLSFPEGNLPDSVLFYLNVGVVVDVWFMKKEQAAESDTQ